MQELGKSNHFFPFKFRIIHSKPQRALSRTQVLTRARCHVPQDLSAPQHGREATGDPGTEQILGGGDGNQRARDSSGQPCRALHTGLGDAEHEDGAGDLGRGTAATARPAGTRGQGHLLPAPPGPVMLCRCCVISVHHGEHRRRWCHQFLFSCDPHCPSPFCLPRDMQSQH